MFAIEISNFIHANAELNKGANTVIVENTNKTFSKGENSIGSKSEIGNKNDKNIKIDKLSESKFVQKANERKSKEKSNLKERIFRHYAEGKISI